MFFAKVSPFYLVKLKIFLSIGETFAKRRNFCKCDFFGTFYKKKKSEFILGESKYKYSAKIAQKNLTLTFQKDPKMCIKNLEFCPK